MSKVRKYLSEIGRVGGLKSRRAITPAQQERMQAGRRRAREQRRLLEKVQMVDRESIVRAMERKQKRENDNE